MLRDWDHTDVRDFKKLDGLWETHKNDDEQIAATIADELNRHLGTNIVEFDEAQSRFFKDYIAKNWHNRGPMVTEREVILEQQGIK
jgi:hypothetical protein